MQYKSTKNAEISPEVRALKSAGVFKRLPNALRYSVNGLGAALKHEAAFRMEVCLFAVMVVSVFLMPLTTGHRGLLIGVAALVLVVELLNSAIEAMVDLVSPDKHELAGRAKDMGSAAVLLCMLLVACVWGHAFVMLLGFA